jgi:hypothetical protein
LRLADKIDITEEAEADLDAIGGPTARWLYGELCRLPEKSVDECPELPWSQENPSQSRRYDIGTFVAPFHVNRDVAGVRVAVVERIVHRPQLDDLIAAEIAAGED